MSIGKTRDIMGGISVFALMTVFIFLYITNIDEISKQKNAILKKESLNRKSYLTYK